MALASITKWLGIHGPAGIMQYPRQKFFSALSAGRALRYFALAYLGRIYGRQVIGFFSRYCHRSLQVTIPDR